MTKSEKKVSEILHDPSTQLGKLLEKIFIL